MATETAMDEPRLEEPPTGLKNFFSYMGPAWIFTASQIGGGEALSVPVIAAQLGMEAIWLIPVVGFTKIFGQFYLVSQGVVSGDTFLARLYEKPWWLRWLFYYTILGGFFYSLGISGHLGTTAGAWDFMVPLSTEAWMVIITVLSFLIVFKRRYNWVEWTATVFLWVFLIMTVIVALLLFPSSSQWIRGFTTWPSEVPALGGSGFFIVAVAFGWIGAGFAPTTTYVWYAKDKAMGMFKPANEGLEISQDDLTETEIERLKGWHNVVLWQNIIASILLVVFSMALWVASAQTLHQEGIRPSGFESVVQMANIFTGTYGEWSAIVLLVSVSLALFTSMYAPAYGVSRLWEDAFGYTGGFDKYDISRKRLFQGLVVFFLLTPLALNLWLGTPVILFSIGGILFAPIIGLLYLAAIYLFFTEMNLELRPYRYWALALAIFAAIMAILSSILSL